jgi:large subunit ribosomal protein L29
VGIDNDEQGIMKAEKIRNLTDVELKHQERDLADQLFKLKFQMNMGQTESLKKIRGLRRDIARVQTVVREQELAAVKTATGTTVVVKTEVRETAPSKTVTGKTMTGKTTSSKAATSKTPSGKTKVGKSKATKTEKR